MATVNMNKAKQFSAIYNVECQLIAGASETNCKAVIYGGKTYKTSNFTGKDFENFFKSISCASSVEEVEEQNTEDDAWEEYIKEVLMSIDLYKGIEFKNKTILEVFDQLYFNSDTVSERMQTIRDCGMYETKEEQAEIIQEYKDAIKEGIILIVGDKIIDKRDFHAYLNEYCRVNKIAEFSQDLQEKLIGDYVGLFN